LTPGCDKDVCDEAKPETGMERHRANIEAGNRYFVSHIDPWRGERYPVKSYMTALMAAIALSLPFLSIGCGSSYGEALAPVASPTFTPTSLTAPTATPTPIDEPTPTPTRSPTPLPTPTSTPTSTPIPIPTPTPVPTPTPTPGPNAHHEPSFDLYKDKILKAIKYLKSRYNPDLRLVSVAQGPDGWYVRR
jgi:hypothetical protein